MPHVSPGGADDKRAAVNHMFARIAPRYDLMNKAMTGGLDGAWRRVAVREAALPPNGAALDIGTGTGDLAIALARSVPRSAVIGLDYTAPMLALAPAKSRQSGVADRVAWVLGDGQKLPFADAQFDSVTSAFVLRNFADLPTALGEMARVTAPGGRVIALEIAPDAAPVWRDLFAAYFRTVVPRMGRLLTGDGEAYTYLPESVAGFLDGASVASMMTAAGLVALPALRLALGTIAVHRGAKPPVRTTLRR
ncbi:MAG: ubiquinone/menaquinone biosynthesis methyltransferase [Anaerolineae bacterium]|jgi:demethylmenaquinone methyltransferase/2-methoxy-6-polyprenyl-1,4-benzoquinol methylase